MMPRLDDYRVDNKVEKYKIILMIAVVVFLLLIIFAGILFIFHFKTVDVSESNMHVEESFELSETQQTENKVEDYQDPQSEQNQISTESGAETEISKILIAEGAAETLEETLGIDASKYQGNINWKEVAAAGVDFAMIRVGYRTMESGEIVEDASARYNLQEATANGIKVGAYFFSTAITEQEAMEEAEWTAELIAKYKITYPVAYNCEGFNQANSRQYILNKEERTKLAQVFLNRIYELGYTPMFYASKSELEGDAEWVTSELEKSFKIWVSWYPTVAYPETPSSDYVGNHAMWQYTNNGKVAGIEYPVDVNVAYFGYEHENAAKDDLAPEKVEANVEFGHSFTVVSEIVTAKEVTNLRNIPSQGKDSVVMHALQNGQVAERTGISSSGWSRVIYNGEIYYAVSSLLTTDLTVKPQPTPQVSTTQPTIPEPDDGIKTEFTPCDDMVSPKIEVNLRDIPSVTDGKVVATLPYGEVVRRTGINEDMGWARVEYNGQTLYCVNSYIFVKTEENTAE